MRQTATIGAEAAELYRIVGIPVVEGLAAWCTRAPTRDP
jgi:hypothetical protein